MATGGGFGRADGNVFSISLAVLALSSRGLALLLFLQRRRSILFILIGTTSLRRLGARAAAANMSISSSTIIGFTIHLTFGRSPMPLPFP